MTSKKLWLVVFVMGIVLRLALVWRPADYRMLFPWRECDYTSIARSFYSEGMNILYPRVDWRGDTSGMVEMEFPALPWMGAVLYHVFGYHEEILRILSAIFSILALFAFAALARSLLPPSGALAATAVFSVNGLLFALSGAIQPESLQLLLSILAVHAAVHWMHDGLPGELVKACAWTATAILAKSPSALLGFLLAYTVFRRLGLRALKTPLVYGSALIAVLPPLLWYVWAHSHFLSTGLSLGLTNETHLLSWVMLKQPWPWMQNLIIMEARDVYMAVGVILATAACLYPWMKIEIPVVWYASAIVFYLVTADTSGDPWAYHYHANSIPPVCLLIGFGYLALGPGPRVTKRLPSFLRDTPTLPNVLLFLTMVLFLARGIQLDYRTLTSPDLKPLYYCCKVFEAHVPPGDLIAVRGGKRLDAHGHPVAYNASMVFTWMERKGFNYAREDFGLKSLQELSLKGAAYWIAQPEDREDGRLPWEAYSRLTLVTQCDSFAVYDLRPLRTEPAAFQR